MSAIGEWPPTSKVVASGLIERFLTHMPSGFAACGVFEGVMLSIEFETPEVSLCPCCGFTTTTLTRFVSRAGVAHAVYYAKFAEGPAHAEAYVLIGLGDWAEAALRSDRAAFCLRIWLKGNDFVTTLLEQSACPWDTDFPGRVLPRGEALSHPWLPDVFAISDQIITEDEPVRTFLHSLP